MFKNIIIVVAVTLCALFTNEHVVYSANLEHGEQIFSANCAACHAGGNNVIMPEKTLKAEALEANNIKNISAIANQVKNGKNAMPSFSRLSDSDIEDVANYVLSKADKGW
uniref:Cytochrome c6 n=2 Tax=Cyanidium caldarium TaxID=2771 RepID=CYC6_CYACA|nr:RecName: Full=Cytochrome c6; AltName: Full=Cytochrome c-553; AltName: Full=Cytochrome c553; AltName: Full=Soluble cytochrome f; Flags: Precursor [Cyanidium caldarium]